MKPPAVGDLRDWLWSFCACPPTSPIRLAASLGLPPTVLAVPRGKPHTVVTANDATGGEPLHVRVYRLPAGAVPARRFLAASAALGAGGVRVPQTGWRRLFRSDGGWRVAIGAAGLPGEPFHPASEPEAEMLGYELRRWHQCRARPDRFLTSEPVARMLLWQMHRLEHGRAAEPLRWPDWIKAATAIITPLDVRAFVGPIGLSPGNLAECGLLRLRDGGIGWANLDEVVYRPLRFDLAEMELGLLAAQPALAERFEAAYFRGDAAGAEKWRACRPGWYRLHLLAAVLRAPLASSAPDELAAPVDRSAGRRRAAHCAAALMLEEGSPEVGQLLAEMGRLAAQWTSAEQREDLGPMRSQASRTLA